RNRQDDPPRAPGGLAGRRGDPARDRVLGERDQHIAGERYYTMSRSKPFADGLMLAEVDGPVGTVVFNQPDKHNAVTVEMWIGLGEIIAEMEADPAIRVVVLRGAGEKAFVSGADISQFDKTRANAEVAAQHALRMAAGRGAVKRCSKPTIA